MDYNFGPDPNEIINVISYMCCFCVVLCSIICVWNAQPKSPTSVISLIKYDTRMTKVMNTDPSQWPLAFIDIRKFKLHWSKIVKNRRTLWHLSRCCWRWIAHVVFLCAVLHCHSLNNHSHATFCQTMRRKKLNNCFFFIWWVITKTSKWGCACKLW